MRKNLSIWMLGIAAVLASCSSEDALQGTNDNDGLVRITLQLEDGMKTRAATPEETNESANVTRFVLSAYETTEDGTIQQKATDVVITPLGSGSFTAKLDRQKYYKFFCWADEGDASSYSITDDDLESIALKQNTDGTAGYMLPTIAHRGESSVVYGETADEVPIQLKHAVAKVMLQTTGALGAGRAKLETKTCTGYNAVTNVYDNTTTKESVSKSGPEADVTDSEDKPAAVLQFYVLTGRTTENVVLTYTSSDNRSFVKNLNSVSFENDYRTIFVGDIAGLQWNTASITATLDENWDDDINMNLSDATFDVNTHTIKTYNAGQIYGNPELIESAIGTGNTLIIEGPMNDTDIEALKTYLVAHPAAALELDLSKVTELTTFPSYGFSQYDNGSTRGLKSIVLPDVMTKIGSNAFSGYCTELESVTLPAGLKEIEGAAFSGCSKLSTIKVAGKETINELPEGLVTLKDAAFRGTILETITIPSSLTTVTLSTLRAMPSLTTVYWKSSAAVPFWCFCECTSLTDIYFTSETAPTVGNDLGNYIFSDLPQEITIHIPAAYEDNYSAWKALENNTEGWNIICVTE